MTARFIDPAYLASGNDRQRAAHQALTELCIFDTLASYEPMLSGTIPLAIDVAGSDLDVICEVYDFDGFAVTLRSAYGHAPGFNLSPFKHSREGPNLTASFSHGAFMIEVFGQALAVTRQSAYRHMMIQARLLELGGAAFRRDIATLRRGGLKTEPAFAQRLSLAGDPYDALLALEDLDEDGLQRLLNNTARKPCGQARIAAVD